jgi:hypothetical protein
VQPTRGFAQRNTGAVRNGAECTGAGRIQTRIRTLGTPYAHYVEVAEAVPALNIMLYNIPIFTGVNLDPATVGRLSRLHNIVAIKEEGRGKVAGAALDVLPSEPPSPNEPLIREFLRQDDWLKGRLLLTPHGAWNSPESRHDARRLSTETVMGYLVEGKLRNLVNGNLLARSRLRT